MPQHARAAPVLIKASVVVRFRVVAARFGLLVRMWCGRCLDCVVVELSVKRSRARVGDCDPRTTMSACTCNWLPQGPAWVRQHDLQPPPLPPGYLPGCRSLYPLPLKRLSHLGRTTQFAAGLAQSDPFPARRPWVAVTGATVALPPASSMMAR